MVINAPRCAHCSEVHTCARSSRTRYRGAVARGTSRNEAAHHVCHPHPPPPAPSRRDQTAGRPPRPPPPPACGGAGRGARSRVARDGVRGRGSAGRRGAAALDLSACSFCCSLQEGQGPPTPGGGAVLHGWHQRGRRGARKCVMCRFFCFGSQVGLAERRRGVAGWLSLCQPFSPSPSSTGPRFVCAPRERGSVGGGGIQMAVGGRPLCGLRDVVNLLQWVGRTAPWGAGIKQGA